MAFIRTDALAVAGLANSSVGMDHVHLDGVKPKEHQSSDLGQLIERPGCVSSIWEIKDGGSLTWSRNEYERLQLWSDCKLCAVCYSQGSR